MLLDIRETVRNSKPIKYTLITVISIPFALVGIGSYFSGGGYQDVAEVDGVTISEPELERAYSIQRQRMAQMFGGQIPENFISEEQIREQALDQLVTNQVVRNVVADQKFAVGDETLGRAIRNDAQFQVDGKFDSDLYQRFVQSRGTDTRNFEESMRQDAALNQFRAGIFNTSFLLPSETALARNLNAQERTVDLIRYSASDALAGIEVSDEEVVTHFDENKASYKFPQRAKIEYIELKQNDLAADIDVTEEDVKEYFEQYKTRYVTPANREASHILLSVEDVEDADEMAAKTAELAAIAERVAAGEDFAALAKEFSDDPGSADNGGSLGQISPGAMVPEFEAGVFALENVGDVSDIINTQYGVHLIKLDSYTAEVGKSFEDVKDEVTAELQAEKSANEFSIVSESLSEAAFDNPENLEVAAENTGLEIKTSDWIDSDIVDDPLFSNRQLQAAVFSDDVLGERYNSELVVVGEGHVVTLRVLEHEEPRDKTLDDVREQLVEEVGKLRADEQLTTLAAAAVEKLGADATAVTELADSDELATATVDEVLTRQSTMLDNAVTKQIYALGKPDGNPIIGTSKLSGGDHVVYVLKSVAVPEAGDDAEAPTAATNMSIGQVELRALIASLRQNADVSLNP